MTNEEFSNEFDTLVDSYRRFKNFDDKEELDSLDFDEYEKSIFLTKAQEQIIEGYYTGKLNGDSFEGTEQLRRYLADLVKTASLPARKSPGGLSPNSVFAVLPEDLWFITYESVILKGESPCIDGKDIEVIPITQDEYHRVKSNPFRRPNSRKALRLDVGDSRVELISEWYIGQYLIRYLSRPEPIILIDLPDNLTINNQTEKSECKLNPGIHRMILDVAVNMAIQSRVPSTGK